MQVDECRGFADSSADKIGGDADSAPEYEGEAPCPSLRVFVTAESFDGEGDALSEEDS